MLPKIVLDRMKNENLSLRDAAQKIGISHTTVARVLNGDPVEIDTLDAVAKWLGVPLATVLESKPDNSEQLAKQLQLILSMYPELKGIFSELAEKITSGEIDPRTLQDVAAYTAYRLKLGSTNDGRTEVPGNPD
jgi:transcriptional regulator with XRE-family HTH domain